MSIEKGQIVISKAGHDSGQFFIVTKVSDGYVFLSDGKERKLESPKKKNQKHIAKTNSVFEIPATDKQLRKLLGKCSRVIQED